MKRLNAEAVAILSMITGGAVWLLLVLVKALGGLQGISWMLLGCGVAWIPCAVVALAYLIELAAKLIRNLQEIRYQLHTYYALKDAMHGMTLNTIGPIYGVQRLSGEENKYFELRILAHAARGGKVHTMKLKVTPKPATGEKLDEIAKKHGLTRYKNESDKHLQDRVREAVMKRLTESLEGGQA